MNPIISALLTEVYKLRKSKMIWITFLAFSLAPFIGGLFMFILKNPELAESAGLIGTKAQIAGEATWPSYFGLLSQMIAVGGILIFGFVTSWVFGREYTDRTIKDLIALPFPRSTIIAAKFLTAFIANMLLSIYVMVIGILIGHFITLPGWSSAIFTEGVMTLIVTALLTVMLSTPVALFACLGRGYLAPLGFVVGMVVFSQIIAALGYGAYFPWAIPALYSGISGDAGIGLGHLGIVVFTSILGLVVTFQWWRLADHT
ncbi:ABC transporter permease [Ornithinibacillus sp. 179-J 7C1 HS]|uniref:ABC transporter permease n=1 Tax=Ornithinibacillus sp. 179-J 7C1 HS TaxID=3142384 RepID=UPI00399F0785